MRILVVDDEYVSRTKLKALLSGHGDVDAVPDGETALRMFDRARQESVPYALVTMDVNMPDMNGQEVVRRMREIEQGGDSSVSEAKILMVTVTSNSRDIMSSFREGAEWYIVKPVTPEKISEALEKIALGGNPLAPAAARVPTAKSPPKFPRRLPKAWRSTRGDGQPATPPAVPEEPAEAKLLVTIPSIENLNFEKVDPEFWEEYSSSTAAKLDELEEAAMDLESGQGDAADRIMRTLHSLKGEAGMIGMVDVQSLCHETETAFKEEDDKPAAVDTVLKVKDWIALALQEAVASNAVKPH
ncbi:MAG: response regulator [Phycisphaerae bacterium]